MDLFLKLGVEFVVQLACVDEQGLGDLLHLILDEVKLGRVRDSEKERER